MFCLFVRTPKYQIFFSIDLAILTYFLSFDPNSERENLVLIAIKYHFTFSKMYITSTFDQTENIKCDA